MSDGKHSLRIKDVKLLLNALSYLVASDAGWLEEPDGKAYEEARNLLLRFLNKEEV